MLWPAAAPVGRRQSAVEQDGRRSCLPSSASPSTLTIGGGFTGIAVNLRALLSPQQLGPALAALCLLSTLLYVFILTAGLLLAHNPHTVIPVILALALQLPIISSPILGYRLTAGLHVTAGLTSRGPFFGLHFGSQWQFNLLQPLPRGLGVNLVAVGLLIALLHSISRDRQIS